MGIDSHLPSHPGPSFYIDPVNRENFDSAAKPSPPVPSTFCTAAGVRSTLAAVLRLARSPPVDSISLDTLWLGWPEPRRPSADKRACGNTELVLELARSYGS